MRNSTRNTFKSSNQPIHFLSKRPKRHLFDLGSIFSTLRLAHRVSRRWTDRDSSERTLDLKSNNIAACSSWHFSSGFGGSEEKHLPCLTHRLLSNSEAWGVHQLSDCLWLRCSSRLTHLFWLKSFPQLARNIFASQALWKQQVWLLFFPKGAFQVILVKCYNPWDAWDFLMSPCLKLHSGSQRHN